MFALSNSRLQEIVSESVTIKIKVANILNFDFSRRVWRGQRGNQNPLIEEEQTTQWPKEKGQKDKQRFTKHYT